MSSAARLAAARRATTLLAAGLLAAGLLATTAACKRSAKPPPTEAIAGLASCRAALASAPALAPSARAVALLRGCPVCGQSFEPLIPAGAGHPDVAQLDALVKACAPACPPRSLTRWRSLLGDMVPGQGVIRPWRALADDCPAAMPTDATTARYAGATWFALATIGDRLDRAAATLPPSAQDELAAARAAIAIPLPPWTMASTGLVVPPGTARLGGVPWRHVTVYDRSFLVGRLAIGRLDGAGWHVDASGPPYPGVTTSGDLARDLAALSEPSAFADRLDDVAVIAPRAAPAARAIAALRALGSQPARFAVALPDGPGGWHGTIAPHALAIAPLTGPRLRLDLIGARIAVIGADGTVRASMALPAGATLAERWRAALIPGAAHPLELVDAVPPDLAVDGLIGLLDDAAAAQISALALAPVGARTDEADRGGFDAAAIIATLAGP